MIKKIPSLAYEYEKCLLLKICGKSLFAFSIGPATNWGKKATKVAKPMKSLVATIFL